MTSEFGQLFIISMSCLSTNNSWDIERYLKYRLKKNAWKTSFDYKTLLFDPSITSMKIPPTSFAKVNLLICNDSDENLSDDEFDDSNSVISPDNHADDDRLAKLVEWEPERSSESDEESIQDELPVDRSIDVPRIPSPVVEDLLITYVHHPVKIEPSIPQIDGQDDSIKLKRLSRRRKKQIPVRTLLDYFPVIKRSSRDFHSPKKISQTRPANYFDNCIVIDDDDDIQPVHR